MSGKPLSHENRGPVAWLTLSGGPIDGVTLSALARACDVISDDESVRCVVVSIERPIPGWDWDALTTGEGGLLENAAAWGLPGDVFGCLTDLSRPVVCAINGDAHGAGFELALACDIRIAAENATFALPEITTGMLPLAGGTQRLPRLVGRGRALEMILSGDSIDAEEALRIGLVSAVVQDVRFEAERIASRIVEQGPIATGYAKEAVSRGIDMPLQQALRFETDLTVILQTTEDREEGVRAFLDKRKPKFKGK